MRAPFARPWAGRSPLDTLDANFDLPLGTLDDTPDIGWVTKQDESCHDLGYDLGYVHGAQEFEEIVLAWLGEMSRTAESRWVRTAFRVVLRYAEEGGGLERGMSDRADVMLGNNLWWWRFEEGFRVSIAALRAWKDHEGP